MLTLQNKLVFQAKPNKIRITLEILSGSTTSVASFTAQIILRKNATVNRLIFTDVNTANSVAEFSTVGTYVAGTGSLQLNLPGNSLGNSPINLLTTVGNIDIFLNPGESLTINGISLSGGGNPGFASISWYEQF